MPLNITIERKGKGCISLKPEGSVDSETAPQLDKKIEEALGLNVKVIILDMAAVDYISSMGLSVMVKAEKALKKLSGSLVVVNIPSHIKKVIEVIEALPAMNIFDNTEELDAYLLKIQREEKTRKGIND